MAERTHLVTPTSREASAVVFNKKSGLHQESSTALHKVGTRLKMSDGRTFYYCRNGATAVVRPGILLVASQVSDSQEDTNLPAAVVAGAKEFTMTEGTGASVPQSKYADGYMVVIANTGRGQTYKIRDNSAIHASGTTFKVYLYDEIVTALDTTSDVVLTINPFRRVARGAAGTAQIMGTNLIPLSAEYYFWLQTWGWAYILRGDSLGGDTGDEQLVGGHTSGISALSTAGGMPGQQIIGNNVYDSTDVVSGEWDLVYLRCIP